MFFQRHFVQSVDFTEIPSGTTLVKFECKDQFPNFRDGCTYSDELNTLTLHGFYDQNGKVYITNEVFEPYEEKDEKSQ